jgi:type VI secretion system VasD/TssJ family lipoprotein
VAPTAVPAAVFEVVADMDINPDREGIPKPVLLRIYELRASAAFDRAGFFDLQDKDDGQLGSDFVRREEFLIAPGQRQVIERKGNPDVRAFGLFAAYRDLEQHLARLGRRAQLRGAAQALVGHGLHRKAAARALPGAPDPRGGHRAHPTRIPINAHLSTMVWQRKVIWAEGMFLRPQHFQQQERFLFRQLQSRSLPGQPFFWGFSELELDTDLLRMGKLGIRSAHGVRPTARRSSCRATTRRPPRWTSARTSRTWWCTWPCAAPPVGQRGHLWRRHAKPRALSQ